MQQFLKDRNDALLSMDKEKITAYLRKYGSPVAQSEEIFWAGVHKARTACLQLPTEERRKSKEWLAERGMRSLDEGDL